MQEIVADDKLLGSGKSLDEVVAINAKLMTALRAVIADRDDQLEERLKQAEAELRPQLEVCCCGLFCESWKVLAAVKALLLLFIDSVWCGSHAHWVPHVNSSLAHVLQFDTIELDGGDMSLQSLLHLASGLQAGSSQN